MNLLSLFSGIGAPEKALTNLGIDYNVVNYCEIDKWASKSYSMIHGIPESKNLGDITKVNTDDIPDADLIFYGFPCQDISLSGKQKGLFNEDGSLTRSGLFFEALRIIKDKHPKIAIAENVKALTGNKFKNEFQTVLAELNKANYNTYWKVLNAKDYGIAQSRERVFIVSIRKDIDNGTFKFPEPIELTTKLKDYLDDECEIAVAAAMRGRYNEDGTTSQVIEISDREISNAITTVQKDSLVMKYTLSDEAWKGHLERLKKNKDKGNGFQYMLYNKDSDYINTLTARYYKDGKEALINQPGKNPRKLTPRECFKLMGFTNEDYKKASKVCSATQLYKQAGNSIVVNVLEHLFMEVLKIC